MSIFQQKSPFTMISSSRSITPGDVSTLSVRRRRKANLRMLSAMSSPSTLLSRVRKEGDEEAVKTRETSIWSLGSMTSEQFAVSTRTDVITSVPPSANRTRAEPCDCMRMFVSNSIFLQNHQKTKPATCTDCSFSRHSERPERFRHR